MLLKLSRDQVNLFVIDLVGLVHPTGPMHLSPILSFAPVVSMNLLVIHPPKPIVSLGAVIDCLQVFAGKLSSRNFQIPLPLVLDCS